MRRSHALPFHILFCTFIFGLITAETTISPRYLQSVVYDADNDRVLFLGGSTTSKNVSSDVYALDLGTKFDRTKANFTVLPSLVSAVADAAAVIDDTGKFVVIGGLQESCTTSLLVQTYTNNASSWIKATSTGSVPVPRQGARAAFANDKILYFGGKSLPVCSSSQYYYNTLYSIDPSTFNWTLASSSSPPVAQAEMTLSSSGQGEFLLVGGEAVSSSSTASLVGMSQFAQYNANSTSWSYLSAESSAKSIASRTGHSSVSNGTHTFVLGGSIGSSVSTPSFLVMIEEESSLNITSSNIPSNSSAPTASLYGHSAILTKNGIMVVAFGLVGSANSTTYNTDIYLYDTYKNEWLDSFDPNANPQISAVSAKMDLSLGSIVAIVLVPLLFITIGLILALSIRKRRQDRRKRQRAFPVNRLGTFSPDEDEHEFEEKSLDEAVEKTRAVHLPPWAAMHACQARSSFVPASGPVHITMPDSISEKPDRQVKDFDIQDVQFAYPPSPRNMTFTAPRLQLRVVNPDAGSARNSFDMYRAMPELIETSKSGLTTSVPLAITNEDDLELLRTRLSNSPMIGDIDDQLAGLGLVIREDTVHVPLTGEVHRVRTISRQKSRKSIARRTDSSFNQATPPRLSIVSDLSSSLDLDSVLAVGPSLSPIQAHSFRDYSPEISSYSPYMDSPRSSHLSSPMSRHKSVLDPESIRNSPIQPPSPTRRRPSGASSASREALLNPWPSLQVRRDNS